MIAITNKNKDIALQVLTSAFKTIPGALWILKKDNKIQKRLVVLCQFCLSVAMQKKGAFISSDNNGVALLFKSNAKQNPIMWLMGYINLGNYCIGWTRAWSIIKRERYIVSKRPKSLYLYFWMLGIKKNRNGVNTILEIKDFIFERSKKLQLPIIAETTVKKNLVMYKRYGFEVYDEWETGQNGIKIWFIQRPWDL